MRRGAREPTRNVTLQSRGSNRSSSWNSAQGLEENPTTPSLGRDFIGDTLVGCDFAFPNPRSSGVSGA